MQKEYRPRTRRELAHQGGWPLIAIVPTSIEDGAGALDLLADQSYPHWRASIAAAESDPKSAHADIYRAIAGRVRDRLKIAIPAA